MSEVNQHEPRSRLLTLQPVAAPSPDKGKSEVVYTVGQVGYDFRTEAVRDSFQRKFGGARNSSDGSGRRADDPKEMLGYLRAIYKPFTKPDVLERWLNENCPDNAKVEVIMHEPVGPFFVAPEAAQFWPPPREPEKWLGAQPPWGAAFPIREAPKAEATPETEEPAEELTPELEEMRKLFTALGEMMNISAKLEEPYYDKARRNLLSALMYNKPAAARLTWTLNQEQKPIYAIRPQGPYAAETYDVLIQFLLDQVLSKSSGKEWFVIPGKVVGETKLLNKQVVPVIEPEIEGMVSWNIAEARSERAKAAPMDARRRHLVDKLRGELLNSGRAPKERALNFAATMALQIYEYLPALKSVSQLELDSIKVEPVKVCRAGSDCWSVLFAFFDAANINEPHYLSKITVDVSDVIPVQIDKPKDWRAHSANQAD